MLYHGAPCHRIRLVGSWSTSGGCRLQAMVMASVCVCVTHIQGRIKEYVDKFKIDYIYYIYIYILYILYLLLYIYNNIYIYNIYDNIYDIIYYIYYLYYVYYMLYDLLSWILDKMNGWIKKSGRIYNYWRCRWSYDKNDCRLTICRPWKSQGSSCQTFPMESSQWGSNV